MQVSPSLRAGFALTPFVLSSGSHSLQSSHCHCRLNAVIIVLLCPYNILVIASCLGCRLHCPHCPILLLGYSPAAYSIASRRHSASLSGPVPRPSALCSSLFWLPPVSIVLVEHHILNSFLLGTQPSWSGTALDQFPLFEERMNCIGRESSERSSYCRNRYIRPLQIITTTWTRATPGNANVQNVRKLMFVS